MIECDFVIYKENGKPYARCIREKCRLNKKPVPVPPGVTELRSICTAFIQQELSQSLIVKGPGTELAKLFAELALKPNVNCKCFARMNEMNHRGIQGCIDTKDEIIGWLQEAYDESSLSERFTAGIRAIIKGYPKTLAGLLDLAIQRAEEKAPI